MKPLYTLSSLSLLGILLISCASRQAKPQVEVDTVGAVALAPERIASMDSAARHNGFPHASFPFYENPNGCGSGATESYVPDALPGVDFAPHCNEHDRKYMRLGYARAAADQEFRDNLRADVERFLLQLRKQNPPALADIQRAYRAVPDLYYQAVTSPAGGIAYQKSQSEAKKYNAWVLRQYQIDPAQYY